MRTIPARHRRRAAARGFTLVEMLIVVAITAIAAALVVPRFGHSESDTLRAAANLLAADLEYAQVESITHGSAPRVVVLDQATSTYRIAPAATPATPITNPADRLPYETTFGSGRARHLAGVTIQAYSLGGDAQIQFGLYGQLDQNTPATITLACGSRRVTVTVDNATGTTSVGSIQ